MARPLTTLALLLAALSCGRETPPAIPAASPRVISLAPSLTEILFAVGAGPNVVGVTSYCDHPPEARGREIVGDVNVNVEKIVSLRPDLVVAEASSNATAIAALRRHKIPLKVCSIRTLEDLLGAVREIGEATGHRDEAVNVVARMRGMIDAVRARRASGARVKVLFEADADPIFVAGPGSYVDDLFKVCGAVNAAADAPLAWSEVGPEAYIRFDPDVILICHNARASVGKRPWWSGLRAVKNGNVRFIEREIFARPTPRLIDNIERIDLMIHGGH